MSKEFYWFNEDANNVQNFYFNNWENFGDQVDDGTSVIAGVIIKYIIFQCFIQMYIFVR